MVDELKNVLLAGLGSAAYTYEKASKVVDDLVQKGKITLDEGKELSSELKRNIIEKGSEIKPLTKQDMSDLLKELNFATKDDLVELQNRIANLEQKSSNL